MALAGRECAHPLACTPKALESIITVLCDDTCSASRPACKLVCTLFPGQCSACSALCQKSPQLFLCEQSKTALFQRL